MPSLADIPAFVAVRRFADRMLAVGRGDFGAGRTPLFAGQMNADTLALPAGTAEDPGLLADNIQIAGCHPFCQNLFFDFGLLDVLAALSAVTDDPRYDAARREYLAHYLAHCRHPLSGYFPWGEHVGWDLRRGAIHQGAIKGCHEVKGLVVPWNQFWAVAPAATRLEIAVALRAHVCDERTSAFNRHAAMGGNPNLGGEPCSLASSAGVYLQAWCWLHHHTGAPEPLAWAHALARLFWDQRSPTTDLFPSGEDRPTEMWYGDVLDYAVLLLGAADLLGPSGADLRAQALALLTAYHRHAYDPAGPGFFDTLDIVTGQPVVGPSRYYPAISRPRYLEAWSHAENSISLATVTTTAAMAYALTGDDALRLAFDRALALMDVPGALRSMTPMVAGDAAGVLGGLVHVARRSGDRRYLEQAAPLVTRLLETHRRNDLFTSGPAGHSAYYAARLGSADLAAALLDYALGVAGLADHAPPLRNPYGAMPW